MHHQERILGDIHEIGLANAEPSQSLPNEPKMRAIDVLERCFHIGTRSRAMPQAPQTGSPTEPVS
jgi:hypothetical protein